MFPLFWSDPFCIKDWFSLGHWEYLVQLIHWWSLSIKTVRRIFVVRLFLELTVLPWGVEMDEIVLILIPVSTPLYSLITERFLYWFLMNFMCGIKVSLHMCFSKSLWIFTLSDGHAARLGLKKNESIWTRVVLRDVQPIAGVLTYLYNRQRNTPQICVLLSDTSSGIWSGTAAPHISGLGTGGYGVFGRHSGRSRVPHWMKCCCQPHWTWSCVLLSRVLQLCPAGMEAGLWIRSSQALLYVVIVARPQKNTASAAPTGMWR